MNTPTIEPPERAAVAAPRVARLWAIWCIICSGAFVLYASTASRGVQWQDRGHNILRIITGEYVNPLGLALSHPLYYWLGRAFDLLVPAEPAFAITLVSAFAGALAVANMFGCIYCVRGDVPSALYAAGSLAVAHVFWQMSTVAEMYTVTGALLTGELWCLALLARGYQRRIMYLLFFLNGLGVSNHLLAVLTTPVWAGLLIRFIRRGEAHWADGIGAVFIWLLGSSPYVAMFISEMSQTGNFYATLHSALFGNYYSEEVLNLSLNWRMMGTTLAFLVLSFPSLAMPLALRGAVGRRPVSTASTFRIGVCIALVVHFVFVIRYHVVDQHTFLVPVIVLTAALAGMGFYALVQSRVRWSKIITVHAIALLVLTPVLYALVPAFARHNDVLRDQARHKPYRDDYEYLFAPWSVVERSADRMSREAVLLAAPRGIVIVEDQMGIFAVQYQVRQLRLEGVHVVYEASAEVLKQAADNGHNIVLVPLHRDLPRTTVPYGSWERIGDLYVWHKDKVQSE